METKFEIFGKAGEELVRDWLKSQGFCVVPASLIDRGGAPLLESHIRNYVLPDIFASCNGRARWVDVKTKARITKNQVRDRNETGCELRLFREYRKVQELTGLEGFLAFAHVYEKRLLIGSLDTIGVDMAIFNDEEVKAMRQRCPNHRFTEAMAFFDVNRFDWHWLEESLLFHKVRDACIEPGSIRVWEKRVFPKDKQPFFPGM
jgi:hypothetical protein